MNLFLRLILLFWISINLISCSVFKRTSESNNRSIASEVSTNCRESLKALLAPARFLRRADARLHESRAVIEASQDVSGLRTPEYRIAYWLSRLENRFKNSDKAIRDHDIELIRRFYRQHNIIRREDVPESYFDAQRRIMREQGHGDVTITDAMRADAIENIREDQRQSLDNWMDYLLSSDADQYPVWVRYWAFEGMLKLGTFNEETGKFSTRTTSTVAPFAELNHEAFSKVVDALVRRVNGDSLDDLTDQSFRNLVESGASFGRLYGRQLKLLKESGGASLLSETEGVWVKYNKGSPADELVESLKGKNTGWCTAGHSTATTQLQGGDFYVYYSKDEVGQMSNPRLAIRMQGNQIAEVRGVAANQNVDEFIAGTDILDNKLKEFGSEGERYNKRSSDMKRLTEIERRNKNGDELTREDLRFLYEIDEKIEGFGYERDPRINEILTGRNTRRDLSIATGYKESEISLTQEEALRGGIKYHHGNLDLHSLTSADELKLPESIGGDLYLSSLTSADGLKLPERIGGYLDLHSLTSADGLKLPESIGGNLYLSSLTSADGLKLPESIGGDLYLNSLASAAGLKLPESIGGDLNLNSLTSADGLKLPESIGGSFNLDSLTSADGLKLPERIGGYLNLKSLTSADGLIIPPGIDRSRIISKIVIP